LAVDSGRPSGITSAEVAHRVDHGGDRPAMPLPGALAALELGAHRRAHHHHLRRRIGRDHRQPQKVDEGGMREPRLLRLGGQRRQRVRRQVNRHARPRTRVSCSSPRWRAP
jgi:hypothetical protein